MPLWTNLKESQFLLLLDGEIGCSVFYENDFFNRHDTLTAVNLPSKINRSTIILVCFFYFDWRKSIAAFCSDMTHLHGILSLDCRSVVRYRGCWVPKRKRRGILCQPAGKVWLALSDSLGSCFDKPNSYLDPFCKNTTCPN